MSRPRPSQSFPPRTDWQPPAVAFFAALAALLGGGRPAGPQANSDDGGTSSVARGADAIGRAFG